MSTSSPSVDRRWKRQNGACTKEPLGQLDPSLEAGHGKKLRGAEKVEEVKNGRGRTCWTIETEAETTGIEPVKTIVLGVVGSTGAETASGRTGSKTPGAK